MPRRPRIEFEGAIHHVTMRGNGGAPIFVDHVDRRFLLRQLAVVAADLEWACLSYCLMTNHLHFVIETPRPNLGLGMRRVASRHAQAFNRRHDTHGHLFDSRYGSVIVRTDAQFAQLLRYVALNPVKARLCSEPAAWPWSSTRATLAGEAAASARVEALLEAWGGMAGNRYARLVDPAGPLAARFGDESPWEARRPPLAEVLDTPGDPDEGMRSARAHGYTVREIGMAVGLHPTTVSRRTRAR
jgi:REP element-mobilizing transposase RayT